MEILRLVQASVCPWSMSAQWATELLSGQAATYQVLRALSELKPNHRVDFYFLRRKEFQNYERPLFLGRWKSESKLSQALVLLERWLLNQNVLGEHEATFSSSFKSHVMFKADISIKWLPYAHLSLTFELVLP